MRKKQKKLTLNTETLRRLEAPGLSVAQGAAGSMIETCPITACDTCRSNCGSCYPCTRYPCPISDEGSCGC